MHRPPPASFRLPSLAPQRGLTRLHWIAVLAALALLTAFGLPRLIDRIQRDHSPQAQQAEAVLRVLGAALELYRRDNGRYPSAQQGLLALVIRPASAPLPDAWAMGGYVDRLPRDPWGHPYQYRADEQGSGFQLFSFGRDGPDGDDDGPGVIQLR